MVRKGKKSKPAAAKSAAPASAPVHKQVPTKQKRRRVRRARALGSSEVGFFEVFKTTLSSTSQQGVLFSSIMHPVFFPNTPYFSSTVNFTHRVEHSWDWKVMITTASFTGVRVAVIPIDDPSPNAEINSQIAFQQVAAGRAAVATSTGTTDKSSSVTSVGSTMRLSNAVPRQGGDSWLGFANGSVFVYLLDAPIGMSANALLQVTVLARPRLTVSGPFVGFITAEAPAPPGSVVTLQVTTPSSTDITTTYHYQGLELDAGYYMDWYKNKAPTTDGSWSGKFTLNSVYQCDQTTTGWTNVAATAGKPTFFVPFASGNDVLLVGFIDLKQAYTFCLSPSAVTKGAAYSITQSGSAVKYSARFTGGIYTFVPISNLALEQAFAVPDADATDGDSFDFDYDDIKFAGEYVASRVPPPPPPSPYVVDVTDLSSMFRRSKSDSHLERCRRQLEAGLALEDTPKSLTSDPPY